VPDTESTISRLSVMLAIRLAKPDDESVKPMVSVMLDINAALTESLNQIVSDVAIR